MTRILGVDMITGSSLNIQYAACLVDTLNQSTQLYQAISVDQLLMILLEEAIDTIAVDHINELKSDPRLFDYLSDMERTEVIQLTGQRFGTNHSLINQAREMGISIRTKPDPLKTAIICALLARTSGQRILFSRGEQGISYTTKYQSNTSNNSILARRVSHHTEEYTHRQSQRVLENSPYVARIDQVIGYGKEAIVYRTTDVMGRDTVVKMFRTYSALARALHADMYRAKQAHIPLLMARNEEFFLRQFASENIRVPEVYFRDDAMVVMRTITLEDGSLAPKLSDLQAKEVSFNRAEELFYHTMDTLFNLFQQCHCVHGDYSANNLLIQEDNIVVIDVSQAMMINRNTFTSTPKRLRMDKAMNLLLRDLDGILRFFERKFRFTLEREHIFDEFKQLVPSSFAKEVEYVIQQWQHRFNQK